MPRNKVFSKALAIGIIFLFICTNIVSGFNIQLKNTTNPLITNRGYIQDLIDNATDGDTIYIPSGIYYENIIINKSISLVGENKNTTIIDGGGSGDVVTIIADEVTVSDITIQNSGNDSWNDAGVQINSNMSNIIGNFIVNCSQGVYITPDDEWYEIYTYSNIVAENNIKNNNHGLAIVESKYTKIYDNNIINNDLGIQVMPLSLPIKNDYQCQVFRYYNNKIYRNNISNNIDGIHLFVTFYDEVYENQIAENKNGIILEGWYSFGRYNNIYQNNVTMNDRGVYISSWNGGSNSNNIYQNNIINNNEGIFVLSVGGFGCDGTNSNNVFQNNIMSNVRGIYINCQFLTNGARNNNIYYNNFIGNTEDAYDKSNNIWDNGSVGNYWDDYKGKDNDKDGIGDRPYNIRPYWRGNIDNYPLMKPVENVTKILSIQQNSQNSQQSFSIPSSITSVITLSSQKQLESRESENLEKLQFWYLHVHVKEIYGTIDDPQYRPLANVTIEIKVSGFGIYWEFFWNGTTKENGEASLNIVDSLMYKVTISKDGYHTYKCRPSQIVRTGGQFLYHVYFTMAEDGSPFVKQISQSSQLKNHMTLEYDIE